MSTWETIAAFRSPEGSLRSPALVLPALTILLNEAFLFLGYTNYALGGDLLTLLACLSAPSGTAPPAASP